MKPIIQSKLPKAGATIFTVMSVLAAEHNAINLGQGFPDFAINETLPGLVTKAMADGHNQYVHMNGLPLLREMIAAKVKKLYNNDVNPTDEITITPGATYALYTALTAILQPGDEVIVFEPAYDCYIPQIELSGAVAVTIPLTANSYKIDKELTRANINLKTKAIIINSPHNPSGAVLDEDDMVFLQEITSGTGIFIISDEVYEHLIFDNKKHLSVLLYPELYERSFVTFSFGKVYNCTGWKTGYCIAPPMFTKEFRKVHQFNAFTVFGPVQYALATFLQEEKEYLQLGETLQQKRDFFKSLMAKTRFEPIPSYGSYFQIYSYKNISEEKEYDMAVRLVKQFGVATIPVSSFYKNAVENKVLRFCFAKKESTLEAAVEKLIHI
ncbi:MAG: aminotransferase class I/II-fold pyridoxal phosphate-dependent enzyme [Ferruginibacter sp.]|nr:aminotransferase class I/II-fold pyridoxal phosphate-dependent enzyme [Ferruginibacter sp.]